ncbi:MAG: cyclic nucleotide-binding domain-containing protein [Acidimicrobiia bacterium]|nr:cyclic nucleotide-binding domain-containing protein [Acidimicrobiia bacterium]
MSVWLRFHCSKTCRRSTSSASLATRLDLPAGRELTTEDQIGHEFLVVLDGEVDVLIGDKVIASRGPGEFFGEIALLNHQPRTATVRTKTPVVVEVIGQREFATMLDDEPEVKDQLMAAMAQRLAEIEATGSK